MAHDKEQFDLFEELKPKPRGGKRIGSGRKSKRGETYVTRIPVAYKDSVEQLLLLLDSVELSEICNKVVALTDKRQ